ncbi:MAG: hypothetical protein K8T90_14200 [Planctomycetes bacterium]|nr:hypothetical protein [Planctomycetota bacterium]
MTRPLSNSDRIAHAASEAEAKATDKAAAKAAAKEAKAKAPPRPRKPRAPKAPTRMKIVWGVGKPGVVATSTFPYNERAKAEAEAARSTGLVVTVVKIAMEATE